MNKNAYYYFIKTAYWLVFREDTNHGMVTKNGSDI